MTLTENWDKEQQKYQDWIWNIIRFAFVPLSYWHCASKIIFNQFNSKCTNKCFKTYISWQHEKMHQLVVTQLSRHWFFHIHFMFSHFLMVTFSSRIPTIRHEKKKCKHFRWKSPTRIEYTVVSLSTEWPAITDWMDSLIWMRNVWICDCIWSIGYLLRALNSLQRGFQFVEPL